MVLFFKILGCGGGVIQGAVGYLFFGGLITVKTIHRAVGDGPHREAFMMFYPFMRSNLLKTLYVKDLYFVYI